MNELKEKERHLWEWVLGIFFAFGIFYIFENPVIGLIFLVLSAVLIPPSAKLIGEKSGILLTKKLKIIIVVVGLIIGGATIEDDTKQSTEPTIDDLVAQRIPNISEKERKEIYKELKTEENKTDEETEKKYPTRPCECLQVGQELTLTKGANLMPDVNPAEPLAAMERIKSLKPGSTIKVLKITKKNQTPWYFVEVRGPVRQSTDTGWINSIALMNQVVELDQEYYSKMAKYENELRQKYENEIIRKYGLNEDQISLIWVEGRQKCWTSGVDDKIKINLD